MAVRAQASTTSLSQYASVSATATDPFYGGISRDFCNSFWGPGDDGVNILFSRMRGATKTTDDLRHFWSERAVIEEQYAKSLATLSKLHLGGEEIGDLRQSLDTLRLETENQAASHSQLASAIRTNLESPTSLMHAKQVNHRRNVQAAVEKKFKAKQTQESYVAKAKEKYDADCQRIQSYTHQCASLQGKELERVQMKLRRTQQTIQANEMDFEKFTQDLLDMMPGWEADWKDFCDTCQDLEEDRLEFMKDTLWSYANEVSTLCVNDDLSCERIRTVLDQLEAERDVENFVIKYGTGNLISNPASFVPYNPHDGTAPQEPRPITRAATFKRISRRVVPHYPNSVDNSGPQNGAEPSSLESNIWAQPPSNRLHGIDNNDTLHLNGPPGALPSIDPPLPPQPTLPPADINPPRNNNRISAPLPIPNNQSSEQPRIPTHPPTTDAHETGGILFYVKALYDYTATIDEEFDFQTGDVIAVTATPDDGWWSGELLDEARREEGRHIFPSNFVCLF
ncbi:hypothetical protein H2248_004299 [Termitomyces sp. 'cryptogamus']|nr:hypothetical protein H2248_004299 [Termitomyces sp. 'cryptogamus']